MRSSGTSPGDHCVSREGTASIPRGSRISTPPASIFAAGKTITMYGGSSSIRKQRFVPAPSRPAIRETGTNQE